MPDMTDNKLATARIQVRIAAADLKVAETRPMRGEDREARVREATAVLDAAVIACAALLAATAGGES
jgi:hypothetical protein